ncbi:phosphate transport system permease protein [Halarchaeum rubridurum]|uniref:Phosphate transport system permease protein PstA n=1 Tax=Halarchaeum rubridurum TaxID=489911 RepID=A0A830G1I0_9EURY|nr:phosphate ABC transporter permease PstA [Halarchaeum rubridurum]MBP1955280.1 phosphate transport system permease protein [Halarchaeum rubridurum]GGM70980.1 phosphate ABC transporter, permease protein PstA [Halarchaeum rubridurum]
MSESGGANHDRANIVTETSGVDRLAGVPAVFGAVAFVVGWAIVFRWVHVTDVLAGVTYATLLSAGHVLAAVVLCAVGVLSTTGVVDTDPDDSTGLFTALAFGAIAFVGVGLTASQTFDTGAGVWLPASVVALVLVTVAVLSVPEDLGVTLPVAAFELVVGLAVLTDVIGPSWTWSPHGFSASFVGPIAIAAFAMVGSLLCVWAGTNASQGFGSRGRELGAYSLISTYAAALLAILVLLIVFVVQNGIDQVLKGAQLWPFKLPFVLNGYGLQYDVNGIFPAIVGTVWLVVGAVVFAVPLAVGAAVYLTEYADQGRFTRIVETATNGLWSTPSIVYGLFAFAFLLPRIQNNVTLLTGQLVLGFMLLPLVLITSREALQNVPDEYRDASAALGVTQWQTIRSVVLPAAIPGVLTGVILGVGRIAGETAPILLVLVREPFSASAPSVIGSFHFTASAPFVTNEALLSPATALPYQLFAVITAGVGASQEFGWGTALVLLCVVMFFYAIGITTRIYFRRKLRQ